MYVIPDKYMDLKTSPLKISADIIKLLLEENKIIKYSSLYDYFFERYGDESEYILKPALSFLYLVGKIKYKKRKDELELVV